MASPAVPPPPPMPNGMDPAYYSLSLLRRRKLDECVAVAAYHLQKNMRSAHVATGSGGAGPSTSLGAGGLDEQLWCIQTKAIILQSWFDDTEIEDDGVDDVLLEGEQAVVSTAHRPNTSLRAARQRTAGGGAAGSGSRAAGLGTSSGRPVSSRYGFARPGTVNSRPGTLQGRAGTAVRPITGRFVRIGTASLMAVPGGPHINVPRLNLEKYAREKPMVAKLLCDYLLYVEHKPKLALELCTAALKASSAQSTSQQQQQPPGLPFAPGTARGSVAAGGGPGASPTLGLPPMRTGSGGSGGSPTSSTGTAVRFKEQAGIARAQDWWWKERLGKAHYQLGLLREAEKHFKAALFERGNSAAPAVALGAARTGPFSAPRAASPPSPSSPGSADGTVVKGTRGNSRFVNYHTGTVMELGKVYSKMDQPLTALELFSEALATNPVDHHMLLCCARLHDELHQSDKAYEYYKQVLTLDSSNVEAIACIAAHFFYECNQPELALRFYRRLLQMGVSTAENWNNMGLCAFFSSQFDFALSCFARGLSLCREDAQRADLWFNVGHIGVCIGDMKLAERAFKLAVATDPTHAEALNNLGVLALEREKQRGGKKDGRQRVDMAVMVAPELVEALYNAALLAYEAGELEQASTLVTRALTAFPDHTESVALQAKLREQFLAL